MGRKKLTMRKIENSTFRQVTFSKRKDGILKKANELAILCNTDVSLIMFSPAGRLTSFATDGRIEDIFLRFVDRPDELRGGPIRNEEFLSIRLKELKREGEMLEKIATAFTGNLLHTILVEANTNLRKALQRASKLFSALEEKLDKLNRRQHEAQERMRYYDPNVEKINSVPEAEECQQFLASAIQHIELSKAKLLGNRIAPENPTRIEVAEVDMEEVAPVTDESADSTRERKSVESKVHPDETCLPMGPHLSLSFIQAQKTWK